MKAKNLLFSFSLLASLALGGAGVFAAYTVTDSAPKTGIRIGISSVSTVTVSFLDENGDVSYSEEIASGGKLANAPANPTLSGYAFDGWATNATTLEKVDVDFSTKTFTENTTYSPRFASYGYKKNAGDAVKLPNVWDINNNISFSQGDKVTLGTYLYNKTSLENATSQVTLSHGGEYALVCGATEDTAHNSAWNSTYAGDLDHWFIQKYITLTRNEVWTNSHIFVHLFGGAENSVDKLFSESSGTDYVYCPYNYTTVTFGAIYNDSGEKDGPNNNWSNVQYKSNDITIDDRTNYKVPTSAMSLWDPSDSTTYRIKFTLPSWSNVSNPRLHYWYTYSQDNNIPYTDWSAITVYGATGNMTQLSGSTYYIDLDSKLPLNGMIIMFDQDENGHNVKISNDITLGALNGAGNYTITSSYSGWNGNNFSGASLAKD